MTALVCPASVSQVAHSIHVRLALVVVALSLCSLLGWLLGAPLLTTFAPGRPAMSVLTAVSLLIAAWALARVKERVAALRLARLQVLTGLAIVMAHSLAGLSYTPFTWFWSSRWTGLALAGAGLSTWLLACGRLWEGQAAAFITLLFATLIGMGHLLPHADLYERLPGSGVAIPTIVAFLALSIGQLLAFASTGITAALTSDSIAGRIGLRLILLGVVVPLLVCMLTIWGYQHQMFDGESALMVVSWCAMALLGSTVWRLAIVVDKAEQARRLAEQQRNSLRHMMAAALTHDLRSPLQAAVLGTELLQDGVDERETAETLALIERAHRRIDRLVRSLLDSLALESGRELRLHPSAFDLLAVVREVLEEHDAQMRERVVVDGAPLQGWWDYDALFRVIENLLMNAVKYGRAGSEILCTVQSLPGDCARLTVSNRGAPIPAGEWEQIFQPFSRGKGALESSQIGWGVGLAYARTVLALHGGTIKVERSNEEGTTFSVTLPTDSRPVTSPAASS